MHCIAVQRSHKDFIKSIVWNRPLQHSFLRNTTSSDDSNIIIWRTIKSWFASLKYLKLRKCTDRGNPCTMTSDIFWLFLNPSAYSKIWDHMWTFPNCKWLWPSGHLMILLYMIGNSEFTNGIKRSMKVLILTLIYQGCWNVHTWTKEFVPAMFWQIHQP